jgi:hypothetical protein
MVGDTEAWIPRLRPKVEGCTVSDATSAVQSNARERAMLVGPRKAKKMRILGTTRPAPSSQRIRQHAAICMLYRLSRES